ncbi:hypothetical protein ACFRNT_30005 [Streptomyces sp. NPDC056697]|uniref:hypothetical protein n=1 Tax=Streptomyces sp. NPDC056697 TaxID=3345915 RepID=UPI0036B9EE17
MTSATSVLEQSYMPEAAHAPSLVAPTGTLAPPAIPQAGPWPRWHAGQKVPAGLPVALAEAWLFVPDGRIVVLADATGTRFWLPSSSVQDGDNDPAFVNRGASQQAQLDTETPHYLGYATHIQEETNQHEAGMHVVYRTCAAVSLAAIVTNVQPSTPTPGYRQAFRRLRVTPHRAVALLGLGPAGHDRARTALTAAHTLWAVPTGSPSTIDELPSEGSSV